MPIYEYECAACDKVFEVQQHMTDHPLESCPDCGGSVRKLVSMSSFQLKGRGWYADGYCGQSNGKGTAGGQPGAKGKNGKSVAKKEDGASSPPCKTGGDNCKGCPAAA